MKTPQPSPAASADAAAPETRTLKRRQLVAGAGVAAGAALAAAALRQPGEAPAALADAKPRAASSEGYRLTEHVRRYYETTRS